MSQAAIALELAIEMLRKSGVQEWNEPEKRQAITAAALEMAAAIWSESEMALPDNVLVQNGTGIILADSTDHAPAAANSLGTRTDQMKLETFANNTAWQSAKVDLGATRAEIWEVFAALEFAATPTAGNVCEFWWAPSFSATAGTANPGNVSGADSAYAGYSANVDASIKQLQFIGDFVCTAQATGTIQQGRVGAFRPKFRYGTLVVYNKSGAAMHSDSVEMSVLISPLAGVVTD